MSKKNTKVVEATQKVLASTFGLYMKTHAYHWNVVGPDFDQYHKFLGDQYTELWTALDDIAERIRILGDVAPRNVAELMKGNAVADENKNPNAKAMLKTLADDHRKLEDVLDGAIKVAEKEDDQAMIDFFVQRLQVHQKARWMLESLVA